MGGTVGAFTAGEVELLPTTTPRDLRLLSSGGPIKASSIKLLKANSTEVFNPFMSTAAFNICCPRDCISRHNGGTAGAPLNPPETIVLSEHYRL